MIAAVPGACEGTEHAREGKGRGGGGHRTSIMSTWDKTVVGVEESSVASDSRAESDPSASFESMMHIHSKRRKVIAPETGARRQEDRYGGMATTHFSRSSRA
jgi:hypothetical protein